MLTLPFTVRNIILLALPSETNWGPALPTPADADAVKFQLVDVFLYLLLLFVIMCNCADDGLVIVVVVVAAKASESCCLPCALPASFRLASLLAYKGICCYRCCCCCCCFCSCCWLLFSFLINTLTNYALLAFLHIVIVIAAHQKQQKDSRCEHAQLLFSVSSFLAN